jgi:23S rRNA (uridine2552-2'-O)-methyltransferase
MKIVDLGAAPGGWSQVIIHLNQLKSSGGGGGGGKKRRKQGFVIAVDLLELHKSLRSEERVYAIQGNFLDPIVQNKIMDVFRRIDDSHGRRNHSSDEGVEGTVKRRIGEDKRVDLVVSDMLANLTGNILRDAQLSLDLCEAALEFSLRNLTPSISTSSFAGRDGKDSSPRLVMKHLQSSLSQGFQQKLRESFGSVRWEKPPSCRVESREVSFHYSSTRKSFDLRCNDRR